MESLIIGFLIIASVILGYIDGQEKMRNGNIVMGEKSLFSYLFDRSK